MRLLLVEDEAPLAESIAALLKEKKYDVDIAYDGIFGEDCALSGIYDAIVLDVLLPGKNGLDVLRSLRDSGLETPILLLTAKSEVDDKICGLDSGADDYLCKPFDIGEFFARIRALTRRRGRFEGDEIPVGETVLDKTAQTLRCRDKSVSLSRKEFLMLETLMANSGLIVPRERLIEKIWGYDSNAEYNAADVYISFVRRKLEAINSTGKIRSARGTGYVFEEGD